MLLTLTQAGQYSGPSGYSGFMSPYQQDVIDTTLTEYDKQAQLQQRGIMDQATRMNALGAGRTGVQLAEYQSGSDAETELSYKLRCCKEDLDKLNKQLDKRLDQQMNLAQTQPSIGRTTNRCDGTGRCSSTGSVTSTT